MRCDKVVFLFVTGTNIFIYIMRPWNNHTQLLRQLRHLLCYWFQLFSYYESVNYYRKNLLVNINHTLQGHLIHFSLISITCNCFVKDCLTHVVNIAYQRRKKEAAFYEGKCCPTLSFYKRTAQSVCDTH